jgi:hypothetical protein
MRATVQTAAAVLLALALAAAPAAAAGERAELELPFKQTTVATESGVNLLVRYLNPEDRAAKPPAITKVVIRLPEGSRIDTTAVPVCTASNDEIQARGRDACPAASKVGDGKLKAYAGTPGDPVTTDLTLFNGPRQLIEVVSFEGTNATAGIDRLTIEGAVLTGAPPFVPGGPPDGRTAVSEIAWDIPARGGYLVTPPTCGGSWTTVGEFGFSDGGETRVEFEQPCVRPRVDSPPPAEATVRIAAAAPRALVRGRRTRVRVRLASDDPACLRGATVRIGRRAARTDAAGRASFVALVRWRRPAARLRVTTPACGTARATLRVRRRA